MIGIGPQPGKNKESEPTEEALITRARSAFHAGLLESRTLTLSESGVASNADSSNAQSKKYAASVAEQLQLETRAERAAGQTLGGSFEKAVLKFIEATFTQLPNLRPGTWNLKNLGNSRQKNHLAPYDPYRHLGALDRAVREDRTLLTVLGNAYAIAPDLIITREPETDNSINSIQRIVDDASALHSPIRARSTAQPSILHAVISCKWTLRSDRAQNARSEALNLIRHRKGRTPHIAVVTGEPTPTRISSIALGTGDIDMVYHFALPELVRAVDEHGHDDSRELLHMMIDGDRLRDISDLPLDLAV